MILSTPRNQPTNTATPKKQDQPLLRLPYELARKNFKTAQRHVEKTSSDISTSLAQSVSKASSSSDAETTLASLDAMLARAQTLKRKLEALHNEEQTIHRSQRARVQHLQDLHEIPSLADVKYDEWSKIRLDRMLVDHLLRQGYTASAQQLAKEKGIEDLVDVGEFIECARIEDSLRQGESKECLAWCAENKQALKKINSNLELELRLQQFVELVRAGDIAKLIEATMHARKHLGTQQDIEYGMRAGGLLANPGYTVIEPYKVIHLPPDFPFGLDVALLIIHIAVHVLCLSLGLSGLAVPPNPPRHLLAAPTTSPPHCPLGRSLSPQDAILPLGLRQLIVKLFVVIDISLSNLQHRTQRTREKRALRPPQQELRRERPRCPAERTCLWQREADAAE